MEKLARLFESSSLPGVQIFINCKQWIAKIVLILSLIFLLGLSSWLLADLTDNYYKSQKVSSSQTVSEYRSQFIALSFCTPIKDIDYTNPNESFSFDLSEPLINCTFDGLFCNWTDFDLDPYSIFQKTPYACYRFNRDFNFAIKYVLSNDIDRGLVMHLNLSKFKQPLDFNSKFKIYIENASTLFLAGGKSDNGESITITSGENIIKVTREIINRFESLNEHCYNQNDRSINKYRLVNVFNNLNKTYQQSDCLDLCYFEKFCNFSYSIQESFISRAEEFIKSKNYECVKKSGDDGAINFNNTIQKECKKECPLECETYVYQTSHSYFGHFCSENSSVTESRIQLSVYYPKLEYTLITKFTRVTWHDLLSQLGGVLGLFFSVNLFSLIEILIILLEEIIEIKRSIAKIVKQLENLEKINKNLNEQKCEI